MDFYTFRQIKQKLIDDNLTSKKKFCKIVNKNLFPVLEAESTFYYKDKQIVFKNGERYNDKILYRTKQNP